MELKDHIKIELDGLKKQLMRVIDTLTQQELMWRPACGCNSMGLLLFHIARSEDTFIQTRLQEKHQIWESGKWYNVLNMAESELGSHYTVDQVNVFIVPNVKDILDYYEAVRASTLDYLTSLTPEGFEKTVQLRMGEFTVAGIFALIVRHTAGHLGEISYLRGMLRGMDK
jgi:uncharacterized damage-inducible protein DinB